MSKSERQGLGDDPGVGRSIGGRSPVFLIAANARSGTTLLQWLLDQLDGVSCDLEYGWRTYGPRRPVHRPISDGIVNVASDIRAEVAGNDQVGSKLVLPIYDYLGNDEIAEIAKSVGEEIRIIHLVRGYWEVLKSNLSRGVVHDIDVADEDRDSRSKAYRELVRLREEQGAHAAKATGVYVDLPLARILSYLENLVRNDHLFMTLADANESMTLHYEAMESSLPDLIAFLKVEDDPARAIRFFRNPRVRKLPEIPDTNIPPRYELKALSGELYQTLKEWRRAGEGADAVFAAQQALLQNFR